MKTTHKIGIGVLIVVLIVGGLWFVRGTNVSDGALAALGKSNTPTTQSVYTQAQLLKMASNKYASGNVPLGDSKYVTDAAKKGYIYLCNVHKDNPGSMVNGPWMGKTTWNFLKKVAIQGAVYWPNAKFTATTDSTTRTLAGNGLPVGYSTGVFPVASSDPAHAYDPNPNTIYAQTIKTTVPLHPVYSDTPYCMGGEVGIMNNGVPLFDGFDAGLRDAAAHELQDSCDGHPQGSGEYHYHSMSACFKDVNETTVLGFAYDGFPITGPLVAKNKYLTTNDLDVCHGITSEIMLDGKKTTTYHYVMTKDFPYSASCFRGKPVTTGASSGGPQKNTSSNNQTGQQGSASQSGMPTPPQEAITACSNKSVDSACSFSTPNGTKNGLCRIPPGGTIVCVP